MLFQVRAEITNKEKEEEDLMEKPQKETKWVALMVWFYEINMFIVCL